MRRDYEPGTYYPKDSQSADIMSKTFPERPGVPKISGDRVPSFNPKNLIQGPMCDLFARSTVRVPANLWN